FPATLRFVAQDDAAYKAIVDAELGYTLQQINASIKAGDDADAISGHIDKAATTLGYVTEAREMANLGEAEERDKVNGLLARYAQLGVGMIPFTEKLSGVGQQLADA